MTLVPNLSAAALGVIAATAVASAALDYITPVRAMAKIGEFPFSAKDGPGLQTLRRRRTYTFAKRQPIASHPQYQAIGAWDEEVELKGYFLLKRVDAILALYAMADEKKAVPLLMGHGEYLGAFLILEIEEERREWLVEGEHLRLDFTIKLGAVYE